MVLKNDVTPEPQEMFVARAGMEYTAIHDCINTGGRHQHHLCITGNAVIPRRKKQQGGAAGQPGFPVYFVLAHSRPEGTQAVIFKSPFTTPKPEQEFFPADCSA
jgi:hypothetical protein